MEVLPLPRSRFFKGTFVSRLPVLYRKSLLFFRPKTPSFVEEIAFFCPDRSIRNLLLIPGIYIDQLSRIKIARDNAEMLRNKRTYGATRKGISSLPHPIGTCPHYVFWFQGVFPPVRFLRFFLFLCPVPPLRFVESQTTVAFTRGTRYVRKLRTRNPPVCFAMHGFLSFISCIISVLLIIRTGSDRGTCLYLGLFVGKIIRTYGPWMCWIHVLAECM